MAPQNTANLKADIWEIFIDDANAPFHAAVSFGPQLDLHAVTTQRYGSTPIATIVQGHMCELSFEWQEWEVEFLMKISGIAGAAATVNKLPAIGTQMPKHKIRLHNPTDGAVTTADLVFPAVCFQSFSNSADGREEAKYTSAAKAQRDTASGDVIQIGYVAA